MFNAPVPSEGIQGILMCQLPGEIRESGITRPLGVLWDPGQGAPFGPGEAGDGEPAIIV
jgi:hypothetical protein